MFANGIHRWPYFVYDSETPPTTAAAAPAADDRAIRIWLNHNRLTEIYITYPEQHLLNISSALPLLGHPWCTLAQCWVLITTSWQHKITIPDSICYLM